jgi:hypothetical protein
MADSRSSWSLPRIAVLILAFVGLTLAGGVACHQSSSTAPTASQAANLQVMGLSVAQPSSWSTQVSGSPTTVNISNVSVLSDVASSSASGEALFQLEQLQGANAARMPIEQWFDSYFRNTSDGFVSRSSAIVGGRPAVRIETSGIGRWAHVFVATGSDVIEISFEVSKTAFAGQYEAMLASIKFAQ